MADGDRDVEVFEHAARWAVLMFEKGTLNVEGWKKEGGVRFIWGCGHSLGG
jgi:hypothetical protein